MAREKLIRCTCDRCFKTIEELPVEEQLANAPKPKVYIESKGVGHDDPIRFDDMCQPCQDRVTALFAQIVLPKKGANKATDKDNDADNDNAPDKAKDAKEGSK